MSRDLNGQSGRARAYRILQSIVRKDSEDWHSALSTNDLRLVGLEHVAPRGQINCRSKALERQAVLLSKGLSECGMPHAVLRGPVAASLFPSPQSRIYRDIDLLVAPSDLGATTRTLEAQGFRQGSLENGMFREMTSREKQLEAMEKRLHAFLKPLEPEFEDYAIVEVHHRLDALGHTLTFDTNNLLKHTDTVQLSDGTVRTLSRTWRGVEALVHLWNKTTHLPSIRARRDLRLSLYVDSFYELSNWSIDLVLTRQTDAIRTLLDHYQALISMITDDNLVYRLPVYYFRHGEGYCRVGTVESSLRSRYIAQLPASESVSLFSGVALDEGRVLHNHVRG